MRIMLSGHVSTRLFGQKKNAGKQLNKNVSCIPPNISCSAMANVFHTNDERMRHCDLDQLQAMAFLCINHSF